MKRLLTLLLILWVSCAQAGGLTIEPYAGGVSYSFLSDEESVVLECKTDAETVQSTVYSQNGEFAGDVALTHTFDSSYVRLTVKDLRGYDLLSERADTVAVAQPVPKQDLPEAETCRKLSDVEFTPQIRAMGYRFRAPGRESVLLKYRSSTESGSVTLYAGDDYVYEGVLDLSYTYHNSNVVLTVMNIGDSVQLHEEMLRTDYPVPDAPQQGTGRLTGITVCIDPGHQAEGQYITEEKGPGLDGSVRSSPGMARGTVTRRMESIVVLEIGFVLRDVLLKQGAAVVMTRETQELYISNIERAQIAADAGADFFLRLHCDNRENENTQGIGIYCPVGSDYARAIADADGWHAMCDILLAAMQGATGQTKGSTRLSNDYIGNNWAKMPSFLIEMGFMSSPVEDLLLSCDAYQRKLAQGMADGIYEIAVYRGLIQE
ncbi:MAG: N-acetylmuramoyl-L-alanine amidase [Clostridiales bacterium]|nr:N-acetylmuramoyl-L-alanine amidase [Clostridiales bacterium]